MSLKTYADMSLKLPKNPTAAALLADAFTYSPASMVRARQNNVSV